MSHNFRNILPILFLVVALPTMGNFYHSDHLGSATWITNSSRRAVQFIHYMPFGEMWCNQQGSAYDERFKFTGKERDAETGYDYFRARYWWLGVTWLSVDPLSDKYPQISPYAYCNWNPIKYIDPDGGKPGTKGCIGLTGTASELSLFPKMVSPFTSGGNTSPLSVSIKGNPQCCRAVDKAKGWFVPLFSK